MVGELSDRTAIVTGASRGIGLATAKALLHSGARVVLTSRTREDVEAAAAALDLERAAGFAAHVADERAAADCVAFALERFGSVDILVNNAASHPASGPLLDQDHARFAKTIEPTSGPRSCGPRRRAAGGWASTAGP